jgi:hypothetical protein
MNYDIFQHKHRFSAWAASRASQRKFAGATTKKLCDALETCGVVEFLKRDNAHDTCKEDFEEYHRAWCGNIIECLISKKVRNVTYGCAAKLLAVYLKSMIIIAGNSNCNFARSIHPPIDRIMLQNLSRSPEINHPRKRMWRNINWTQLNEVEYYNLIRDLVSCVPTDQPFWILEKYWTNT